MLLLLMLIYSYSDVQIRWYDMRFTPIHVVLLLVARHSVYRKELRMVSNIKINVRSGIKK